ncbi:MAG: hypothetical protein WCT08_01460 [Patescibacteria group bacterium]|jgi:DNA polymerase III delta prime subunit
MEKIGQKRLEQALLKILKNRNFGHAIIFSGNDQLAVKQVSKWFAEMLICQKPKLNKPCNNCPACLSIARNEQTLITILNPENQHYSVEQIRNLKKDLALKNSLNLNRAVVLNEIQYLRDSAANALLKVLEEPGKNTYFIFTANNILSVLKTLSSRAIHFIIQPVAKTVIEKALKSKDFSKKDIELALKLYPGKFLKVLELLENTADFEEFKKDYLKISKLLTSNRLERLNLSDMLNKNKTDHNQKENFQKLINILIAQIRLDPGYMKYLPKLMHSLKLLQTNANPKLLFESILIQIP